MPRLDTGFPTADAQDDFQRARRRQVMSRLGRRLGRGPGDVDVILPFEEVVGALGRVEERYAGLQTIPLDSVLGTVDRKQGFDRQFRPTTVLVRARWERIANAVRRGEAMPPISVYRIGEVHFVRDGHHRVSVARALGRTDIDAYVVEVVTRVGAERSLTVGDLPTKSHERLFHERVPAPRARPRPHARARRVELRRPGGGRRGVGLPRHAGARRVLGPPHGGAPLVRGRVRARRRRCCARPTCSATAPRPTPTSRVAPSATACSSRTSGARTCSPACASATAR